MCVHITLVADRFSFKGPEICNDMKGMKLDYWVSGYGKL